jgi:GH15 family glucan-1,4-alpha-glucosidase
MPYQPIEDHGVIGDMRTLALVGMDGAIDFMCYPYFDSPTIFCRLLDDQRGGTFRLAPMLEDARHSQMYLPETNVLLSRFLSNEGVAEVSDFMPLNNGQAIPALVRRAKAVLGKSAFA